MPTTSPAPRTLVDKIWDFYVVDEQPDGTCILFIDRHLVHEVTSPQAFDGLRASKRKVRRPDLTLAVADHNVPTTDRSKGIDDEELRIQLEALDRNCKEFGIQLFGMDDIRQGICHVIGPEQGFTLPGTTMVCGDSHTATHGAFGSLAFGIGTSEVEHVLATQTMVQKRPKNMRITVDGALPVGVTAKDMILAIIGKIGTAGGTGSVIEYAGQAVRDLDMAGRMTVCNMSIEAGARAGLIAPDEKAFEFLKGRPMTPKAGAWEQALAYWTSLPSDPGAKYDVEMTLNAKDIVPMVTWGTSPEDVVPITGKVPDPSSAPDEGKRKKMERALQYMGLTAGTPMQDIKIDTMFVGSCTNSRIEDLRAAAAIAKGRKVASHVRALVVPGSGLVKEQAEAEGLDKIFTEAGFEWREPGCSMCLAMNADKLKPGERSASTSNRNFEGRQGPGGRTHLLSPAMAVAAAIKGKLADVREFNLVEKFTSLTGVAAPLPMVNVDTDMIIPARFLKSIKRDGFGPALFYPLRYDEQGKERPEFILNQPAYRNAKILIAGRNFGCGSSREHAPWALDNFGIRCVIAPEFADIFFNNASKNGMLLIKLPQAVCDELTKDAENGANATFTVDLEKQEIVRPDGQVVKFDIDPHKKYCLMNGLDDIGLTLKNDAKIAAFEAKQKAAQPWV